MRAHQPVMKHPRRKTLQLVANSFEEMTLGTMSMKKDCGCRQALARLPRPHIQYHFRTQRNIAATWLKNIIFTALKIRQSRDPFPAS